MTWPVGATVSEEHVWCTCGWIAKYEGDALAAFDQWDIHFNEAHDDGSQQ